MVGDGSGRSRLSGPMGVLPGPKGRGVVTGVPERRGFGLLTHVVRSGSSRKFGRFPVRRQSDVCGWVSDPSSRAGKGRSHLSLVWAPGRGRVSRRGSLRPYVRRRPHLPAVPLTPPDVRARGRCSSHPSRQASGPLDSAPARRSSLRSDSRAPVLRPRPRRASSPPAVVTSVDGQVIDPLR